LERDERRGEEGEEGEIEGYIKNLIQENYVKWSWAGDSSGGPPKGGGHQVKKNYQFLYLNLISYFQIRISGWFTTKRCARNSKRGSTR
jgi:hypothetical protein